MRSARFVGVIVVASVLMLLLASSAFALETHQLVARFGPEGTGGISGFTGAAALAVDESSGDVYLVEIGDGVVEKFNAAGEPADFTAHTPGVSGNELTGFTFDPSYPKTELAVGPINHDLYVVNNGVNEPRVGFVRGSIEVFKESGEPADFTAGPDAGTNEIPNSGETCGVAVDANGDIYTPAQGIYAESGELITSSGVGGCDLAVDSYGDVYSVGGSQGGNQVKKFTPSAFPVTLATTYTEAAEPLDPEPADSVAVDRATDDVYVDQRTASRGGYEVVEYDEAGNIVGEPFGAFGEGALSGAIDGSEGVAAVGPSGSETVYASDAEGGAKTDIFGPLVVIQAKVEEELAANVSASEATLSAKIDPLGEPTSYRVEYGTTESYGSSTPEVGLGSPEGAVGVRQVLTGLQPGTSYHYRFVATNTRTHVSVEGADRTFTTTGLVATSPTALPDGRVYEDVSLSDGGDEGVYHPDTGHDPNTVGAVGSQRSTTSPMRAAADGDAIAYAAGAPGTGGSGINGEGGGNAFLATRGSSGWEPRDIQPPLGPGGGFEGIYQGFSSDLSLSFLVEHEFALAGEAPPPPCAVLYSRGGDGAYRAAFDTTETPGNCGSPKFAGVSANDSSTIFESAARLTEEAEDGDTTVKHETFNLYDSVAGHVYLVNILPEGQPDVNAAFGGVSGKEEGGSNTENRHYGGAISANGSAIVWTDLNTGDLYVRENPERPEDCAVQKDACTVLVAEGAHYRGASSDGSTIFFTDERKLTAGASAQVGEPDLYECQVVQEGGEYKCAIVDLTVPALAGEHADVQGLLGSSEDGSYVYVVAKGVLASNEREYENDKQETEVEAARAGEDNLYVLHAGEAPRFIAALSAEDNEGSVAGKDWHAGLSQRTAEVTPDGQAVVFVSHRSLTGYQNLDNCRRGYAAGFELCPEVFTYDASAQRLECASCNPTGAPTTGFAAGTPGGSYLSTPASPPNAGVGLDSSYQLRVISANGGRVFFDSYQPLTAQAIPGEQAVYEWEAPGEGTCTAQEASPVNGGCVFLLSGSSNEEAVFVDADETGSNVFFTTRAQLVPEDQNELVDLYDARVEGGFPHLQTACQGTGCQGVPPAPPIFATPSSATFNGTGNFPPPTPTVVKPKTKTVICKKDDVKNHKGKCVPKKKKHTKAKKSAKTNRRTKS